MVVFCWVRAWVVFDAGGGLLLCCVVGWMAGWMGIEEREREILLS